MQISREIVPLEFCFIYLCYCVGWCSKILEGVDKNSVDDYGIATERSCMQRAPSDGSERYQSHPENKDHIEYPRVIQRI